MHALSAVALLAFWCAIRGQVAIADREFLQSMIPHHAGAILMCKEAKIESDEIRRLCQGIIQSQQAEIAHMKALLGREG
jgi:uncharacterized protein (DUF305 family)